LKLTTPLGSANVENEWSKVYPPCTPPWRR